MSDLHKLYQQTKNPLYIWQAVGLALSAEQVAPVPEWCLAYLRDTATRLAGIRSSSSKPWLKTNNSTISAQVMQALALSKQGQRNAFDAREIDRRDMAMAKPEVRRRSWHGVSEREITPPTESDKRAQKRRIKRGKSLLA